MRVFKFLTLLPEKLPLVHLASSSKSLSSMPSQALSAGSSLLKVGAGLGGVFSALCPSAIAAPLSTARGAFPGANHPSLAVVPGADDVVPRAIAASTENGPSLSDLLPLSDSSVPASNYVRSPALQPLPPLSSEALTPDPLTLTAVPLQPASEVVSDQLCQSIHACKGDIAIAIDAAAATTLGEPAAREQIALEGIAKHVAAAPLDSSDLVPPAIYPLKSPAVSEDDLPKHVKLSDLIAELPASPQIASPQIASSQTAGPHPTQTQTAQVPAAQNSETSDRQGNAVEDLPGDSSPSELDDDLGVIRAKPIKTNRDDLGILRLLQTATPPPRPKRPIAFLTGRLGYISSDNAFRLDDRLSEQTYQSGLTFRAYPRLSRNTSLYAIAETSLGRFEKANSRGYNEIELQVGVRQKLFPRTYAQFGLRNQRFYSFGYEEQILGITYIDTSISHRSILNKRTTLDSFYQARVGFADRETSSRIRQTLTFSINYAATQELRASLLYQLGLEDYTKISRFDTFQQIIASISYRATPESRITLFGGTRFGDSSGSIQTRSGLLDVNLDDTFYGAELSVNLPLF